jgi:putative oxidoreductase
MSTSKTSQSFVTVARILLGLIYLFFGLNFFFHFIHGAPPDPSSKAGIFLGGLFNSGYFFLFLKTLETIYGLLLLADWFVPLVIILVFPVSLNIFLFHSILAPAPAYLGISVLIIGLNLFLAWGYRHLYRPLLNRNNTIQESISSIKPVDLNVVS